MTSDSRAKRVLAVSLCVTAALYALPYGRAFAWPLILVSTLAHELGHGLAAALLGGRFNSLAIYPDASGVAIWSGRLGGPGTAAVAGAGLVGPALAAFVLLALGRRDRGARLLLGALGAGLLVITLLLVRNPFGFAFVGLLAAICLAVAIRLPEAAHLLVVLTAVQLALSVFSRSDYLFTNTAVTATGRMPSDVAVMSSALFLPYWFWGALCGGLSIVLLAWGVKVFFRR